MRSPLRASSLADLCSFYKGKKTGNSQSSGSGGSVTAQKDAKPSPPNAKVNGTPNGNAHDTTPAAEAGKKRARDQEDENVKTPKSSKSDKNKKKSKKERAMEATNQVAIKKAVKKQASRSPISLAKVVEHIAEKSSLKASRIESALLEQLYVTLGSDGQLHVA